MKLFKALGGYDDVQSHGTIAELRLNWGKWSKLHALTASRAGRRRLIIHYERFTFPFGRVNHYFELQADDVESLKRVLLSL